MGFEQAQIPVQKVEEFEQLKSAIERIFSAENVSRFYSRLQDRGIGVREFEKILSQRLVEEIDPILRGFARSGEEIYHALSLSDQALLREFYLEKIEKVDAKIRYKYRKVYQYY